MNQPYPILVVEDSSEIRGLLEASLHYEGYQVASARNGDEALAKIGELRPAVIITDLLMPEMDGYTLLYRLYRNEETRDIPAIVISATYVGPEDEVLALSLGAFHFIRKPFDIHEFLLAVGEAIHSRAAGEPKIRDDETFYEAYKARVEAKLQHKAGQLARNERLLADLPDAQKADFQQLLGAMRAHRDQIAAELEEIRQFLQDLKKEGGVP
jgi:CheY-like chemotaxis protein